VVQKPDSGTQFNAECSSGYVVSHAIGRIKNEGDSDLIISDLDITGRDAKNFRFTSYNPADPTSVFSPVVIPPGASYDQEFGLTAECRALGKTGRLRATAVLTSNDPERTTISIPFSAIANRRPNILITGIRGSLVTINGSKFLRFSFTIGNSSPTATRTRPEVGVELAGKTHIVTAPRTLKGGEAVRLRALIPRIPRASAQVIIGTPSMEPLAMGEIRVDPRNRIFEGNEDRNGNLYDLENADVEYASFQILGQ
jgi:hypothetical protein